MNWQHQVRLFMTEVKELELPNQPMIQAPLIRELCKALCYEEFQELVVALTEEDIVEIADAIADLIYVALYTANAYGLYMEPIFQEVQRSNMAKKGGPKAANGKQQKPEGWAPPDIASIVKAQQYRPIAYIDDEPVAWQNPDTGRIVQE